MVDVFGVACMVVAVMSVEVEAAKAVHVQEARVELDNELIRETVEAVAEVVDREYFDRELASQVKAKLEEQLRLGRYRDPIRRGTCGAGDYGHVRGHRRQASFSTL